MECIRTLLLYPIESRVKNEIVSDDMIEHILALIEQLTRDEDFLKENFNKEK